MSSTSRPALATFRAAPSIPAFGRPNVSTTASRVDFTCRAVFLTGSLLSLKSRPLANAGGGAVGLDGPATDGRDSDRVLLYGRARALPAHSKLAHTSTAATSSRDVPRAEPCSACVGWASSTCPPRSSRAACPGKHVALDGAGHVPSLRGASCSLGSLSRTSGPRLLLDRSPPCSSISPFSGPGAVPACAPSRDQSPVRQSAPAGLQKTRTPGLLLALATAALAHLPSSPALLNHARPQPPRCVPPPPRSERAGRANRAASRSSHSSRRRRPEGPRPHRQLCSVRQPKL
jgi:hypothetical protein